MKFHKIFEGDLLFVFWSTFLIQMFSKKHFCKENISKIVGPLLAGLSVSGLRRYIQNSVPVLGRARHGWFEFSCQWTSPRLAYLKPCSKSTEIFEWKLFPPLIRNNISSDILCEIALILIMRLLILLLANLATTKWCTKPEKWLKPWHRGTYLRVLSKSYPISTNMTGLK